METISPNFPKIQIQKALGNRFTQIVDLMECELHGVASLAHQLGKTNDKKRMFIGTLQILPLVKGQEGRNSPRQELTTVYN